MPWKRPSSVPYPKVWYRFYSRDVTESGPTDHLVEYRVEDLAEDRFEDAIRHYTENFAGDEPLAANRGIINDPDALMDQHDFWRWCFNQKMTLVCYKEGSDEIIGTNLLLVKSITDAKKNIIVRSQSTRDIIEIHEYMMTERFNVFERLRVDRYLTAVGLAINRRYRGLGIATEMLRARIPMCLEFQIPVTVTDFTARGSQRAAEKAGFQVEGEVTYDELAKMVWKRPAEVPYPKVWHRFQAKGLQEDGQLEWYTVQDLPEDRFEDAIRHMSEHFARDEQLNKAKGLDQDVIGMEEVVQLWKIMLPERLSLVCFREGSDAIVGVNILGVASKYDNDELKLKSDIFRTIIATIEYISHQANVFERYGVDQYLNAMGLSVDPVYRGRGIATELLRARVPLCKGMGLKLTSTCFTGPGSQAAARKAGFEENFNITYAELAKVDPRFVYPGLDEKSCKYMSLKID